MSGNISAAEIAQRFNGKRSGKGWIINCPCHEDKNPSCSILDTDDGNVRVTCFAGCDYKDVRKALGLDQEYNNNGIYKEENIVGRYKHPDGKTRKVYRIDNPKTIRQTKGLGIKGCYLLLWGTDAPSKTIVICEGEKAALALQNHFKEKNVEHLGIPASYIGGIENVHNTNYEVCKDRNVTIWPDNDKQGLEAGTKLGHILKQVGAKLIKIINVSDIIDKGDAADVDANTAFNLLVAAKKWTAPQEEEHIPRNADGQPTNNRGGAREGAGRKETDNPSEKTIANRRTNKKNSMINLGEDLELPSYLRVDSVVKNDAARLIEYCNREFLSVTYAKNRQTYINNEGFWRRVDLKDSMTMVVLRNKIEMSRYDAKVELDKIGKDNEIDMQEYIKWLLDQDITARETRDIVSHMKESDKWKNLRDSDFNDRETNPVYPLEDGGAIRLDTLEILESPVVKDMYMTDTSWGIPELDWNWYHNHTGEEEYVLAYKKYYGDLLLDRISLFMAGISKSIDVYAAPSDAGKNTLHDAIARAFPNSCAIMHAEGISRGGKFTPAAVALTECWILFVDETTHGTEFQASTTNEWANEYIDVEEKGRDRYSARRIGNVMMMADEWPNIDSDSQGWENRYKWAFRQDGVPKMEPKDRFTIIFDDGIKWFRHHLIYRCHQQLQEHDSAWLARIKQEENEEIQRYIEEFKVTRADEIILFLLEMYEPGDKLAVFTSTQEIKDIIFEEGYSDKKLTDKIIKSKIIKAFGYGLGPFTKTTKNEEGKRPKGYALKKRE